jgi:pyruvyl transferase EpsO
MGEHKQVSTPDIEDGWIQCIKDIQEEIESLYADLFNEKKFLESDVIYIDPAQHGNLGDAFIVEGTHRLLARLGISPYNIYTCRESQARLRGQCDYTPWLKKDKFIAIWHGGGNWGDGWDFVQRPRIASMKKLITKSNATIISFPQSMYYVKEEIQFDDAEKLNRWIQETNTSSKLVLSFRQENQIELAKSLYPRADVRLVPDIAFMIGPLLTPKKIWTSSEDSLVVPSVDILFVLRTDKESSRGGMSVDMALDTLRQRSPELGPILDNLNYKITDWGGYKDVYPVKNLKEADAMLKVEGARNLLALGKVIVSDRLHCSILALLMHKPHVFIEQSYGKISNTRNTAFRVSDHCTNRNLKFQQASDLVDAIESAIKFL